MRTMQTPRTLAGAALAGAGSSLMLACASAARGPLDARLADRSGSSADSVMVGYGVQRRSQVTGSVVSLIPRPDEHSGAVSVADLVRGRMPGVVVQRGPGGAYTVRIRGAGALREGGEPLYVLDGVPLTGPEASMLAGISPNDVARIDVLRDAASAAIYGSRGGYGVILITTKRGPGRPR